MGNCGDAASGEPTPSTVAMTRVKIELVCFDLGRVLIHIADSWCDACVACGVPVPAQAKRAGFTVKMNELCVEHECGRIDNDTFDRRMAEMAGLTAPQVAAVSDAWIGKPYCGVAALIDQVRDCGARTACLSNTNDRHWHIMSNDSDRRLPLDRLHFRFASHLIGAMKPSDKAYAHVEAVTKIAPHAIVYFDDDASNVDAAVRRGWQAVRLDPANDPVSQMKRHLRDRDIL